MVDLRFFILKFWLVDFFFKNWNRNFFFALLATFNNLLGCQGWPVVAVFCHYGALSGFCGSSQVCFPLGNIFFWCLHFFLRRLRCVCIFLSTNSVLVFVSFFLHYIFAVLFCSFCAFLTLLSLSCVSFCVGMKNLWLCAFFLCVFASPPLYLHAYFMRWCVCLRVRLWLFCCARFALVIPCFPLLSLLPCSIAPFRPIIMLTARVSLRWTVLSVLIKYCVSIVFLVVRSCHARLTTVIRCLFCLLPVPQPSIMFPCTYAHPWVPTMVTLGHP